ncbi:hypothetical protein CFBP6600_32430 [Xanthomonas arboricola pv. corylina]|uniref:Uncharacterized protein n=1 Tax=Xanthomonas arboricola pv. corylina TaxID=487821 RepID=A0ABM8SKW9_9XANT|nr:hypothetical protein XacyCFBP2565_13020 [Xanthomonas arboricola pv. corylina]CAE6815983.1 hypothetical protein XAC301_32490 [Xanthomonas arboricola pv. corylina]CAE6816024.1 hypothetical protein XAC301_32490 [Xanthomonas arboricola pv. corylina]CAE6817179.1 hypothetical protein CFBP6600_32430 [Xanthomonas arboricola pv. corylina]CAE6817209.1 hypothetical protein CFBP6600_32430 [Xanthomonas arboricola pv. corylina]
MAHHHASPMQLKSGEWGARVPASNVQVGDELTVVTRSGSSRNVMVSQIAWQNHEVTLCETVNVSPTVCKFCGAVDAGHGYPFSTLPRAKRTCDDCA